MRAAFFASVVCVLALPLAGCAAPATDPVPVVQRSGAPFALPMRLVGAEPFWGVRIAEDAITFSRAGEPDVTMPSVDPVVTGAGARWTPGGATITIVRGTCSDGMSDRAYPFEATVALEGETLRGCAGPESLLDRT